MKTKRKQVSITLYKQNKNTFLQTENFKNRFFLFRCLLNIKLNKKDSEMLIINNPNDNLRYVTEAQ